MTPRARAFLDMMVGSLGFRYLSPPLIGFQQTTDTYARYERLRQAGLDRRQAVDEVLYHNRYYSTYLGH